ncbi:MAG: ABC transporter transmembrane domain-containing protein, partial [Phenylobacterium sp.]|nr:ABC transporter transmembrane domain-containing protein [Phenylobacterium sp.]
MTEHYDDTDDLAERTLSNRQVLGFIGAFWLRRPVLFWTSVVLTLVAIGFDLALPWAAGRLMDIVAAGPDQADLAWRAWAIFIGVFFAFTVVRNIAFRFWNPMAAANMKDMTDEGFKRVQSYSADWHANTFAGSTVRRLSRGMWGYDMVSDAVILWLGPA